MCVREREAPSYSRQEPKIPFMMMTSMMYCCNAAMPFVLLLVVGISSVVSALSSVPATGGGGGGGGSHSVSSKRLTPFVNLIINLIMDIDVRQEKDAIPTSSQTASTSK